MGRLSTKWEDILTMNGLLGPPLNGKYQQQNYLPKSLQQCRKLYGNNGNTEIQFYITNDIFGSKDR